MKTILAAFLITSCLVVGNVFAFDVSSSCVKCHGDKKLVSDLGFPQMYLDPQQVEAEVNMGEITCVDCHLGDSSSMEKDIAHKGMPRPFYAAIGQKHKYQAVDRGITNFSPIQPQGDSRFKLLMRKPDPEKAKKEGIKQIRQLFYHDRDPETMAYAPKVSVATCGKCHPQETEDYNKSGMGRNMYQRGFTGWTVSPPGPQNCGAWFGDNHSRIADESGTEFSPKMSAGLARGCNKCHAGCNDCHYQGYKKSAARHLFSKKVEPLSCYGSGKGTICHAGPSDRRRGAGYLREEFAFPVGELPPDAHAKAGVGCLECHQAENHDFGHLASAQARQACKNCHADIVAALQGSEHGNVDCASCHVQAVGAYQFTFWGPGKSEGQPNTYTKHKEYYGVRSQPTLIKHPDRGVWVPLKPYPMGVLNIKKDVAASGLMTRAIKGTAVAGNTAIGEPESFMVARSGADVNDMYIINGTFPGFKNNKILAWIQMDKMSHALGKARECASCHASHEQKATSWYTYNNMNDVQKPFSGSYTLTANKNGLFFTNFISESPLPVKGQDRESFAPYLQDSTIWNVQGIDFSIPFDKKRYDSAQGEHAVLYARIHSLKQKYKKDQKVLARIERIKIILPHSRQKALEMLGGL